MNPSARHVESKRLPETRTNQGSRKPGAQLFLVLAIGARSKFNPTFKSSKPCAEPPEECRVWVRSISASECALVQKATRKPKDPETGPELTDAAIRGARDELMGLKENIIIGHLIPAGTGMYRYQEVDIEGAPQPPEPEILLEPSIAEILAEPDIEDVLPALVTAEE